MPEGESGALDQPLAMATEVAVLADEERLSGMRSAGTRQPDAGAGGAVSYRLCHAKVAGELESTWEPCRR